MTAVPPIELLENAVIAELKRQNLAEDKDVGRTKYKVLLGVNEGIMSVTHLVKAVITAMGDAVQGNLSCGSEETASPSPKCTTPIEQPLIVGNYFISQGGSSEIPDNRAEFEKALLETHPGTPLGMTNGLYDENCVEGAWRGWNLRKPEPVSSKPVSLMDSAMALQGNQRIKLGSDLQAIAKTVLDAAGVPYVD